MGIEVLAERLRNRDFYWCEDSSVVLSGLIKGGVQVPDLDVGCGTVQLSFA